MPAGKNPEPRKTFKKIKSFNYQVEEYIHLPKKYTNPHTSFFDIINERRSERNFTDLSINQVSHLLWNSARAKKITLSERGTLLSRRPSPSAGSIHPIDIFISLSEVLENRELYYYEPFTHRLAKLKIRKKELGLFFNNINNCLAMDSATLMWFVAQPERTAIKYKNFESLVWRDAGALITTVQLVATALNIKSCPIGTLGEPFLSQSFRKNLFSAGGLLLG